jgi:MFS family permease
VLLVALCGGMLMSLPYSLLMPLMHDDEHGALTGLYSVSRGLGVMLGPLLAGLAISLGKPLYLHGRLRGGLVGGRRRRPAQPRSVAPLAES